MRRWAVEDRGAGDGGIGTTFTVITASNTTNAFPAGALRPNLLRNA